MSENILNNIISKKIERVDALKKSISLDSLNEIIDENNTFIDFSYDKLKLFSNDELSNYTCNNTFSFNNRLCSNMYDLKININITPTRNGSLAQSKIHLYGPNKGSATKSYSPPWCLNFMTSAKL